MDRLGWLDVLVEIANTVATADLADAGVAPPRRARGTPSSSRLGLDDLGSPPPYRHFRRGHLALCAALTLGCHGRDAPKAPAAQAPAAQAAAESKSPAPPEKPQPSGPTDRAAAPANPEPVAKPAPPLSDGTPDQLLALKAGNEALARQDSAAALSSFIEAFDGPTTGASISAGLAAAELHAQAGRDAEAGAFYGRLLQMAPDIAEIRFTAGRFYSGSGQAEKAVEELEKAIALQPDFLPAYPLLGGVLAATGAAGQSAELMLTYETRLKLLIDKLGDPGVAGASKVPIIDVLALIEDDRATRALIAAVAGNSVHARLAAADALSHDPDPAALEAISKAALAETDPIARRALTASLKAAKQRFDAGSRHPEPKMPTPGGR